MNKKEIIEKLIENNYDTHIKKNIAELTGNAFQDDEYIGEYDVYKEQIYFEMQDEHHKFLIGLRDILLCILFAEEQGLLPEHGLWWYDVMARYEIPIPEIDPPDYEE